MGIIIRIPIDQLVYSNGMSPGFFEDCSLGSKNEQGSWYYRVKQYKSIVSFGDFPYYDALYNDQWPLMNSKPPTFFPITFPLNRWVPKEPPPCLEAKPGRPSMGPSWLWRNPSRWGFFIAAFWCGKWRGVSQKLGVPPKSSEEIIIFEWRKPIRIL